MRRKDSFTLLIAFVITVILIAMLLLAFHMINPPPMTGRVINKNHHPAYFPVDMSTPEVFVLAITDDSGKWCASWIVSEDRWNLYDIGDTVEWLPRFAGEDT